jgi:competence protein ComEC
VIPRVAFSRSLALGVCLTAVSACWAGSKDGTLDLYWIDSEGGGSTLIVSPTGTSVLMDSGNPGVRDPGRIHRVATEVAGLRRIDHLVVTHFHIDHFGGAAELAALMPIGEIWDNGLPEKDPDGQATSTWPLTSRPYREIRAAKRHPVKAGSVVPLGGGESGGVVVPLELRCFMARQEPWRESPSRREPAQGLGGPELRSVDRSDNANSSVWVLTFGGFRFYDGGDVTWNAETRLVWPEVLVPEVDVYQVTHHGLDVSNHPRLLAALNPAVSVMNNGPTKGAMGEVFRSLALLPGLKAQYQVHRNVRPDGATNNCPEAFIANLGEPCAGAYLRCSVDADGAGYTMSNPSRGHSARYLVKGHADRVRRVN